MKIGRDTKQRIEEIKSDIQGPKQALLTALARLEEHSGTKRICRGLQKAIRQLDEWQRS